MEGCKGVTFDDTTILLDDNTNVPTERYIPVCVKGCSTVVTDFAGILRIVMSLRKITVNNYYSLLNRVHTSEIECCKCKTR